MVVGRILCDGASGCQANERSDGRVDIVYEFTRLKTGAAHFVYTARVWLMSMFSSVPLLSSCPRNDYLLCQAVAIVPTGPLLVASDALSASVEISVSFKFIRVARALVLCVRANKLLLHAGSNSLLRLVTAASPSPGRRGKDRTDATWTPGPGPLVALVRSEASRKSRISGTQQTHTRLQDS